MHLQRPDRTDGKEPQTREKPKPWHPLDVAVVEPSLPLGRGKTRVHVGLSCLLLSSISTLYNSGYMGVIMSRDLSGCSSPACTVMLVCRGNSGLIQERVVIAWTGSAHM